MEITEKEIKELKNKIEEKKKKKKLIEEYLQLRDELNPSLWSRFKEFLGFRKY